MAIKKRDKKGVKSRTTERAPLPGLDPQTVVPLVNGAGTALDLATGAVVFAQGDQSDAVFYVETGKIQISVVSDQGKEAIIAMFGPGDFFGEGCLTAQPVRLASATAMASSHLVRIEKGAMATRGQPEQPVCADGRRDCQPALREYR